MDGKEFEWGQAFVRVVEESEGGKRTDSSRKSETATTTNRAGCNRTDDGQDTASNLSHSEQKPRRLVRECQPYCQRWHRTQPDLQAMIHRGNVGGKAAQGPRGCCPTRAWIVSHSTGRLIVRSISFRTEQARYTSEVNLVWRSGFGRCISWFGLVGNTIDHGNILLR